MKRITWLSPTDPPERFPPLDQALDEPPGLLAVGGDLSPSRLLAAYRRGIFPWYAPGQPVLWWSPDPRMVLFPEEFHCSRSLAKTLRNKGFTTTMDRCFEEVIRACGPARANSTGTWITPEMESAYLRLHQLGHAHSLEVWLDGRLAGGLYGVRIGAVFFGESMFSAARDASKVALAQLAASAPRDGIALIDCQLPSPHLESLGCRPIPRRKFRALIEQLAR